MLNDDAIVTAKSIIAQARAFLNEADTASWQQRVEQLERTVALLRYNMTEKRGFILPPPRERAIHGLRCEVEGCHEPPPYWNYNPERTNAVRWRCMHHYPRGVTFPIGMHGEDFEKYKAPPVPEPEGR